MKKFRLPSLSLAFLLAATVSAKAPVPAKDSLYAAPGDTVHASENRDGTKGFARRVIRYFLQANNPDPKKKVDFGVIPGPHYSSTTGLGLGILGTATYSADRTDSLLPRSNAMVYTDATTGGFFLVGLKGTHFFPHGRYRLDYKANVSTFSASYWGIGYDAADDDANESDYRRNRILAMGRFLFHLGRGVYLGPIVHYRVFQAKGVKESKRPLWLGEDLTIRNSAAGLSLTYDSRDFMLGASRGVFLQLDQTFSPRFMGNGDYGFSATELTISSYKRLWHGAVLAGEWHSLFTYGSTPWPLLAEVGSNDRMRGYYEGRYRDKNLMEGQVELRQRIKGRHGAVLWVALANAFPSFDDIAMRRTLPNAGIGYRWEFKKGINIRIDYGYGRQGGGFIFNLGEAF